MNDYIKATFTIEPVDEVQCDVLAALLCDAGFESFEQTGTGVVAYAPAGDFSETAVNMALEQFCFDSRIVWEHEFVEGRDWNEEWEKNYFTPMVIADRCVIHSTFHKDYPKMEYDIVIDPKMAFGTGHHETTCLMVEQILREDMRGATVLDMGTGTGILAMLASKCGAKEAVGIEIDEFAFQNTLENVKLNAVEGVTMLLGDASLLKPEMQFDYVIANINRNIITADIGRYAMVLREGGKMLLSGFYEDDIPVVLEAASPLGLHEVCHNVKNRWTMLLLTK